MGYQGNSVMDCGYFYAPYIELSRTPVVLAPQRFPQDDEFSMQQGDPGEQSIFDDFYLDTYEYGDDMPEIVDWLKEGF